MRTLRIDAYVFETLMPDLVGHDRQPSAFLVYMCLWHAARSRGARSVQLALMDLAEQTGLSKRSVQSALSWLSHRKLILVARASITAVPLYTVLSPWRK